MPDCTAVGVVCVATQTGFACADAAMGICAVSIALFAVAGCSAGCGVKPRESFTAKGAEMGEPDKIRASSLRRDGSHPAPTVDTVVRRRFG